MPPQHTSFRVEWFESSEILIPKLLNRGVPHYRILEKDEINKMEQERCKPREKFQPLLQTDAIARYMGLTPGLVVQREDGVLRFVQ